MFLCIWHQQILCFVNTKYWTKLISFSFGLHLNWLHQQFIWPWFKNNTQYLFLPHFAPYQGKVAFHNHTQVSTEDIPLVHFEWKTSFKAVYQMTRQLLQKPISPSSLALQDKSNLARRSALSAWTTPGTADVQRSQEWFAASPCQGGKGGFSPAHIWNSTTLHFCTCFSCIENNFFLVTHSKVFHFNVIHSILLWGWGRHRSCNGSILGGKKQRELISAEPIFQYNVSGLGAIFSPSASCTHCSSCGYFWQRGNIISSYLAKILCWQFHPHCWNNLLYVYRINMFLVPSSVAHSNTTLDEKLIYLSSTGECCLG